MNNDPFIFLHVPKTAGTTLRAIIERQYLDREIYKVYDGSPEHHSTKDLKALDEEEKEKLIAYCGHVAFGVHESIGGNLKYYTLLRDPVERVISFYHHTMTLSPRWRDRRVSLLKFIQEAKHIEIDNLQTRLLSGIPKPFGRCQDGMVWTAIDNIERHFDVVGLSEWFDESLVLMQSALGWEKPFYVKENIGRGRPAAAYYSHLELEAIRDHNRLDSFLYSYVKRRLKQRIKRGGEPFRRELAAFRKANAAAGDSLAARTVWPDLT
jgi:hypothetical protein